jgi:hypothetical protein
MSMKMKSDSLEAFDPTSTKPGTEARIEVYAARLAELEEAGHRIDLLLGLDLPSIFVSGDDNEIHPNHDFN